MAKDSSTHGSLFVPVILGSDKTTVSVATGQNNFYPLYLSIGNVQNHLQRSHKNSLVLIVFLPIPKGVCPLNPTPSINLTIFDNSCEEGHCHQGVPKFQTGLIPQINRFNPPTAETFHDKSRHCTMP